MKYVILIIVLTVLVSLCVLGAPLPAPDGDTTVSASTPLHVVNQRMSAYNRHDLPALLATYSDSVAIFTYPRTALGKGKDHLRWVFEDIFQEGVAQVEVHHQFTIDSYVVNHETVDYGTKTTDYVSIYEVKDGLIQSVTFVRD
jgi:hypothetical protein